MIFYIYYVKKINGKEVFKMKEFIAGLVLTLVIGGAKKIIDIKLEKE